MCRRDRRSASRPDTAAAGKYTIQVQSPGRATQEKPADISGGIDDGELQLRAMTSTVEQPLASGCDSDKPGLEPGFFICAGAAPARCDATGCRRELVLRPGNGWPLPLAGDVRATAGAKESFMSKHPAGKGPGSGKAEHGAPSEVNWDSGAGRQPYANREDERGRTAPWRWRVQRGRPRRAVGTKPRTARRGQEEAVRRRRSENAEQHQQEHDGQRDAEQPEDDGHLISPRLLMPKP